MRGQHKGDNAVTCVLGTATHSGSYMSSLTPGGPCFHVPARKNQSKNDLRSLSWGSERSKRCCSWCGKRLPGNVHALAVHSTCAENAASRPSPTLEAPEAQKSPSCRTSASFTSRAKRRITVCCLSPVPTNPTSKRIQSIQSIGRKQS